MALSRINSTAPRLGSDFQRTAAQQPPESSIPVYEGRPRTPNKRLAGEIVKFIILPGLVLFILGRAEITPVSSRILVMLEQKRRQARTTGRSVFNSVLAG